MRHKDDEKSLWRILYTYGFNYLFLTQLHSAAYVVSMNDSTGR